MSIRAKEKINVKGLGIDLTKRLKRSGECILVGVGTFKLKKIKARKGINPKTFEAMTIPKHTRVKFKVSETIKNKVNAKKK